ncbi:MAG: pitrilysin family protein [Flavobacterium sp.]|uniref:M16 family metallopeptidase n=1 Tax=Flavobacterium sp. TaxID=239 RepID=UPI003265311D
MKNITILISSLLLTVMMQAQDRTQPKPGPSPTINIKKPESFTLSNGLKVLVVENHKLPRVSFSLSTDNAPYTEGAKKGVSDLLGALIGNGSTKTPKNAFNEEIDFLGADISFAPTGAFASGLSKYAKRILELTAEGLLQPNFTQEELDKEKDKLIESLKSQEKSVTAVAGRVENVLAFGKNHPSGEYLTEESIKNISLADIQVNYNTYFVPEHAYLVVLGDVKLADVKKEVETLFSNWVSAKAPNVSYSNPKNVQYSQINFIDMPNAVQSEISIINTINVKMSDSDLFPLILANQVLGGDFNGYLNMNLREKHGWTYGSYSNIGFNKYVSTKFKANAQVRNAVTDSSVVEAIKEIKRIRTEKVTDEVLNNVKAGYVGKFVMQVEKPETVARYALNIEKEGLSKDFYENYIKNINLVTADDIMRVAKKYFLADNLRIIVVGKGSDVLPGLEKTKIPMFFFDKYGNPVEKPVTKKVDASVTVKSVLDKYISAIGGEKAVKDIKTTFSKSTATIQGMPMELSVKTSAGKLLVEMNAMGMTMMKQMVNDKTGYMEQQGQRKVLEGDMLTEMRSQAQPFPELTLATKAGVTLLPIQSIEGKDAYGIKDGKKTYFYDVTTGLKIGASEVREANGQTMTQNSSFSDYKDVKGVKMPHKTIMNVGIDIELTTTEIKVNEGVTDADFQ